MVLLPRIHSWWHLLCQTEVQSLNYGKIKGRKTENREQRFLFWIFGDCFRKHTGCLAICNATQVDTDLNKVSHNHMKELK